jgi:hypothetical protein
MRLDLLPLPARCGPLRPALCMLVLTTLFAGAALAAPRVEAIADPADPHAGCGFRTVGAPPAGGWLVLFWNAERGTMNIDGKTVALKVTEEPCRADCVAPGKSGTQVFRFMSSDGVQATLRTRVHCPRDAEVCSGLFASNAKLAVSSARGKVLLQVRNEDCDY